MQKNRIMPRAFVAAMLANMPAAVLVGPRADATESTEELLKEITQNLDRTTGELKQTAENALSQAQKSGQVSAEVKATADELLKQQTDLTKAVQKVTADLQGITAKQAELEQHVAEGGRPNQDGRMSLGQAVAGQKEKLEAFAAGGLKGNLMIKVENAITTATPGGGGLIYRDEERVPVPIARRTLRIRQLLNSGRVSSDMVKYRKQVTRTSAAAMVAEEGTIPESSYGWDKAEAPVRKVGHVTNISEEAMADADQLQSELDSEMRYGLDLEEDKQLLAGDGTGENLSGLLTEATAFVAAAGLPNATRIDRLRLGMLQISLADYVATSMVLNPTDWAAIDLLKDSQSRFIFGNPGAQSTPMLWGKDVVDSNSMTAGEWLVGDLLMAATIYDREDVEVLISSEHGTNFIEDMLTMKATKRLALAIKRPAAMVTGNFTFA